MINESFEKIKWYDNVITNLECQEIHKHCLKTSNWGVQTSLSKLNLDGNDQTLFWHFNFDFDNPIIQNITKKIKKIIGENYSIDRCYVNGQTTLQEGNVHFDANPTSPKEKFYTFLIYINPKWNITWGGCTVFLNQYISLDGDIKFFNKQNRVECIRYSPQPSCGLFFPSNYLHYAEAPSKHFSGIRMTLAFKLVRLD